MTKQRSRNSEGATFEDGEALLLKAVRQLRALAPPAYILVSLDQIEADVEQRRARRKAKPAPV